MTDIIMQSRPLNLSPNCSKYNVMESIPDTSLPEKLSESVKRWDDSN